MTKYNVMLARFPGNCSEHPNSSNYIINLMPRLMRDERIDQVFNWFMSDTPITMVRNKCVAEAVLAGIHYVLMIDSDMNPDFNPYGGDKPKFWDVAWNFLMRRREDEIAFSADHTEDEVLRKFAPATIAAPYCGPPPIENCYIMKWESRESSGGNPNFTMAQFGREEAASKTGIEEVGGLPTGLIIYDIRVFKHLPPPWFAYEWSDKYQTHKASTEDIFQTRNASMMGLPQFVAWDCWAGHYKMKCVHRPTPFTVQSTRVEFAKGVLRAAGMKLADETAT